MPARHPIDWQDPGFYDEDDLSTELARVFDICHGCQRCISLCNAFPTLFDLVDEPSTMEVDGVAVSDYSKVVGHCYLCDLCFMTKCPYAPSHEWNVDFPHLMLHAQKLQELVGIENRNWVQARGLEKVFPVCDEDLPRETTDKTSAVHFMRFELDPGMIAALKNGAPPSAGTSHAKYQHTVEPLPDSVRSSLVADLD